MFGNVDFVSPRFNGRPAVAQANTIHEKLRTGWHMHGIREIHVEITVAYAVLGTMTRVDDDSLPLSHLLYLRVAICSSTKVPRNAVHDSSPIVQERRVLIVEIVASLQFPVQTRRIDPKCAQAWLDCAAVHMRYSMYMAVDFRSDMRRVSEHTRALMSHATRKVIEM